MVFNAIICTSRELFGNSGPFITMLIVAPEKYRLFILSPWCTYDFGIELIVPSEVNINKTFIGIACLIYQAIYILLPSFKQHLSISSPF
jgi:hypothetical protein